MHTGSTLGGYHVERQVGADALGVVYRASDASGGLVRLREMGVDAAHGQRLRAGLTALEGVEHRQLPRLLSVAQPTPERLQVAWRWVEGVTLAEAVAGRGALAWPMAVALLRLVLRGLERLHEAGVAHGALSAGSVCVERDQDGAWTLRLLDAGLWVGGAAPLEAPERHATHVDALSPERIRGAAPSPASDLYSAGVLLHTLLTGQAPFASERVRTTLKRHVVESPLPVGLTRAEAALPGGLQATLDQALAKRAGGRPASARAMREALARLSAVTPEEARGCLAPGALPLSHPMVPRGSARGIDAARVEPAAASAGPRGSRGAGARDARGAREADAGAPNPGSAQTRRDERASEGESDG